MKDKIHATGKAANLLFKVFTAQIKTPKYSIGEILETDNFGTCKVVGVYRLSDSDLVELSAFAYALEIQDDKTVQYVSECEIQIRGL